MSKYLNNLFQVNAGNMSNFTTAFRLIVFLFLLFSMKESYAQEEFQRLYFPDAIGTFTGIVQTTDGNYLTTAIIYDTTGQKIQITKMDKLGSVLWEKTYYSPSFIKSSAYSVKACSDGGFIIGGSQFLYNIKSLQLLLKIDSIGDIVWSKLFKVSPFTSTEFAFGVVQTSDGGYAVGGYDSDSAVVSLTKFDSLRNIQWTRKFRNTTSNAVSLATKNNSYVIAAQKHSPLSYFDIALIRIDSLGNTEWVKTYGDSKNDVANVIKKTNDNSWVVGGWTTSYSNIPQMFVFKTDDAGNIIWAKTFSDGEVNKIEILDNGDYLLVGTTENIGAGSNDIFLARINALGSVIWSKTYGTTAGESPKATLLTDDNGYLIAGYMIPISINGIGPLPYSIKTDSVGNSGCQELPFIMSSTSRFPIVNSLSPIADSNYIPMPMILQSYSTNPITETVFCSLGVSQMEKEYMTVFPNPSYSAIHVVLTENSFPGVLKLLDVSGKTLVKKTVVNDRTDLNVASFPSGWYILVFTGRDGKDVRQFIIVSH